MFHHTAQPRTFQAALRDMGDPKPKVRIEAVGDLVRHADEHRADVLERLCETLANADEQAAVRAAAALALADVEATEAVPELLNTLAEAEQAEVLQMAVAALGELGDGRAREAVRDALSAPAPAVRFQAVIAFPRVCDRHPEAVQALLDATQDDDPVVCHIALRMAEELGADDDEQAVDPAFVKRARELLDHDSADVRVAAAIILARSGEDDGDPLLVAVANGELRPRQAEDEAAAIELCGECGLREATASLERRGFGVRLSLRRDPFAWQARVALAAMGHPRAVQWVLQDLRSSNHERRTLAVAAAGRAGLEQARPLLEAMQKRPERVDPEAIDQALRSLGGREPE